MSESDNQEALLQNKFQIRSVSSKRFEDAYSTYAQTCQCRPVALLLALPFALVALVLSLVGAIVWLLGLALTYVCPCLFFIPVIVELALGLILAPILVFTFIIGLIPF